MNTLWQASRLLIFFTCLHITVTHATPPHPACNGFEPLSANTYRFSANLNGRHGSDLFVADRTGKSTIITACDYSSTGPWDMHDTNKPLNTIVVIDVEGDGKDELIIGGPTGSSALTGAVTRLIGKQLELMEYVSIRPASDLQASETFQCIDSDGEDIRETGLTTQISSPRIIF